MIQEVDFSNKKKITLKRYNDLINRYNGLIDRWNAINLIKDNTTASKFFGSKAGVSIKNEEKDKDKLVLNSNRTSIRKTFNEYGTYTFDIPQGFYHVILSGAGAGGLCSEIDINNGSPFNGNVAGSSGSIVDFIFYAPFSVQLVISIGCGGEGKVETSYQANKYVYGYPGGDSAITLNGILLCKCEGGKSSRIYYNASKKSSIVYQDDVSTYLIGNLVRNIRYSSNGLLGNGAGNGDITEHTCPIISEDYKGEFVDHTTGETIICYLANGGSSNKSNANIGVDGYCFIESYIPTDLGFISNGIELKSKKLHILENENNIRNKIDESLLSIYNSLMKIDFSFDEERCYRIGKETFEDIGDLTKFDLLGLEKNPLDVDGNSGYFVYYINKWVRKIDVNLIKELPPSSTSNIVYYVNEDRNYYNYNNQWNILNDFPRINYKGEVKTYKLLSPTENNGSEYLVKDIDGVNLLSKVITSKKTGCFTEDNYIITYDGDTPRKLNVYNFNVFDKNSLEKTDDTIYYMFCNKNNENDIIYLKEIKKGADVYVYDSNDKELKNVGTCDLSERVIKIEETSNGGETKYVTASKDGYVNCIIVGAGGGGGGGSGGDHWFKSGAGGGSGSYFNGIFEIKEGQTFEAYCGKGGKGGNFTQKGPGRVGYKGENSLLKINSEIVIEAGAGGGGSGTTKHGSSGMQPSGNKGIINIISNNQLIETLESSDGYGNTDENKLIKQQEGMKSPYEGTNYGEGGRGGNNGNAGWQQHGLPGKDGYVRLALKENLEVIWNNKIYKQYNGYDQNASIILYGHFKYLENRLDALENYLSVGKDWFDGNGYCRRSCQIKSQVDINR